jgi:8-oxo-dGTP diphosphatase
MPNTEPDKIVHVAVAVIRKDGKVLVAKRADNVHQGGLWEFPGGKVETSESISAALKREISEELGIDVRSSRPLIKLIHHYEDKSVCLDTHVVEDFAGKHYAFDLEQPGLEGQRVKWIDIAHLSRYQFPAANKPIMQAISLPEHYAITPDLELSDNFFQQFERLASRCSLIQLRLKSVADNEFALGCQRLKAISKKHSVHLMLNSEHKKYFSEEFKGLHLTGSDLYNQDYVEKFRQDYPSAWLSASCHNNDDVRQANQLKLDFMVLSPVQKTESHPEAEPMGWEKFNQLVNEAMMPVYALGGVSENDLSSAQLYGAQGIAAIRSLWPDENKQFEGVRVESE